MVCAALLVLSGTVSATRSETRIMPVGDSITDGQGSADGHGYRDDLYALLVGEGWDFDFVGDSGESPYEGHFGGGGRIADFYPAGFGNGWGTGSQDITEAMNEYEPHVLLVHLGTNDVTCDPPPYGPYSNDGGQSFMPNPSGRLSELLLYVLRWAGGPPGAELETIVLCQIIPIRDRETDVCSFNSHIAHMVEEFNDGSITGRPEHILRCDQYAPFAGNPLLFSGEPGDYMDDSLHPNDLGYAVMAETFLASLLDNTPPAAVSNLSAAPIACYDVTLSWTAVGDDVLWGVADAYEAFVAPFPVTPLTLTQSFALPDLPCPAPPGSYQTHMVRGLPDGVESWYALRTLDGAGNVAGLSNTPEAVTPLALACYEPFGPGWEERWIADSIYVMNGECFTVIPSGSPWGSAAVFRSARLVDQVGIAWEDGGSSCALCFLDTASPTADGWAVVWSADSLKLAPVASSRLGDGIVSCALTSYTLTPGDSLEAILAGEPDGLEWWCYHNNLCRAVFSAPDTSGLSFGGVALSPADPALLTSVWMKGRDLDPAPEAFSLLVPNDGDTIATLTPELVWQRAWDPAQPVTYKVRLDTSATFGSAVLRVWEGIEDTFFVPPTPLAPLPLFWWDVRAVDLSGLVTSCLRPFSFRVDPGLDAPDLPTTAQPTISVLGNPFSQALKVRVQDLTGSATIELYNAAGRLVGAQVVEPRKEPSVLTVARPPAPGPYVLRLSAAGSVVAQRIILVD